MSMNSPTTKASGGTQGGSGGTQSGSDKAAKAAEHAQEHTGATVDAAKQEASDVVRSAKDHAMTVVDSTTSELQDRGREQTDRLSSSLGDASEELRRMADATDGSSMLGGVVKSLADNAQRVSRRLDEGGPEGVLDDVRRMGRQHPVRFLAMAAASGFMAARVLRSTDTDAVKREMQSEGSSGQPGRISGQGTSTAGLTAGMAGNPAGAPTVPAPGVASIETPGNVAPRSGA